MNIENILKQHKKSVTPERVQIFQFIEKKHLFTASDIEQEFSHIGRASIFRSLKLFVEIGVLRRISLWDKAERYEVECCQKHHHEHMKCHNCWEIISFESEDICSKIFSHAKKLGFHVTEHSLSIFGTCKNCNT